jgi:hypothetical protein
MSYQQQQQQLQLIILFNHPTTQKYLLKSPINLKKKRKKERMPTKDKDFKTTTMPILDFNLNHPPK